MGASDPWLPARVPGHLRSHRRVCLIVAMYLFAQVRVTLRGRVVPSQRPAGLSSQAVTGNPRLKAGPVERGRNHPPENPSNGPRSSWCASTAWQNNHIFVHGVLAGQQALPGHGRHRDAPHLGGCDRQPSARAPAWSWACSRLIVSR